MSKRLTEDLKAKLSSMHNATPAFLTDELGTVRAKMKLLKDEEDLIKTVLETKLRSLSGFQHEKDALKGSKYILQVIKTTVARFSQEKAKSFLTPEQFEECFVSSPMTQYRCKRIDDPGEET